jgi:hypothetical protein
MEHVTVQFFGICTHVESGSFDPPPTDWTHRVVLVRGDHRAIETHPQLRIHAPEPHVATLQILTRHLVHGQPLPSTPWFRKTPDTGDVAVWTIDGALLRIANAEESKLTPITPTPADCIPHLKDRCTSLPRLGRAAFGGDAELTYACFDFLPAPVEGRIFGKGASVGVVTVDVSGDAILEIRPIAGDDEPVVVVLGPDAEITVANIPPTAGMDKEDDFLLHFLATEGIPDSATPPPALHEPACPKLVTDNPPANIDILTGPGCSNSNYP